MAKRKTNTQPWWRFLFVLYCAIMLWLLFGRSRGRVEGLSYRQMLEQNINLTPLYTIRNYWYVLVNRSNEALWTHCFINLAGNVLLFIPAGYLLPRIFPKQRNFFRFFFSCTGIMLAVELLQLVTLLGSFDVDDLILNTIGGLVGYILYYRRLISGKK